MKVYKDFDEVIKPTEVPEELWESENEMKKKPNFDKTEYDKESEKSMIWKKNYT